MITYINSGELVWPNGVVACPQFSSRRCHEVSVVVGGRQVTPASSMTCCIIDPCITHWHSGPLTPEQYHLNNSTYGPFGQGLPHPHSNHSTVGLNKYASLKAVGKSETQTWCWFRATSWPFTYRQKCWPSREHRFPPWSNRCKGNSHTEACERAKEHQSRISSRNKPNW